MREGRRVVGLNSAEMMARFLGERHYGGLRVSSRHH
jgi:hypothetical protein